MTDEALLQNFEREPLFQLHSSGTKNGSDRPCRPALFADDFAEVALSNSKLKNRCLFAFYWTDSYLIRIIYKRFRDLLDELLHSHLHTRLLTSIWSLHALEL